MHSTVIITYACEEDTIATDGNKRTVASLA